MIKEVDSIPKSAKTISQRDLIRADINDALTKGISKFEFVGDDYNYKYLQNYAREEAGVIVRQMIRDKIKEIKENQLSDEEKRLCKTYYCSIYELQYKFITIVSVKACENVPHRRVFCNIDFSDFDDSVMKFVKKNVESARKFEERRNK